ncbi:hypothetical protein ILUMI_09965 [Ignelater luminosus]|uniref:Gamma-interferon-inducible lysosomal thiol reductase n=1 Tax=Ignelater luminosus TaxID=2038154 RepID=A0A8K0GEK4_IGNLU|nr:hypothetical protein ILUMI_09965 [Ignelater luminosus]
MKSLTTIILVTLFYCFKCEEETLKLSIYYETLCPDSIRFFRNQLNSTYEKIGSSIEVDFIPYGFATQYKADGKWTFHCQHGTRECSGNKYHACELAQENGEEKDVQFLDCSMRSRDPTSSKQLQICAENVGVNFTSINECFKNGQGDELLIKYGERTNAVSPKISYIPTIIINDVFSQEVQNNAEFDLLNTVCKHLSKKPPACL